MTPQEQAEAMGKQMARELLHSRIHSHTKFEDTLATALSKLIAENENLRSSNRLFKESALAAGLEIVYTCLGCGKENCTSDCPAGSSLSLRNKLQSKLTATEAKLREYEKYVPYVVRYPLTAEKKEHG